MSFDRALSDEIKEQKLDRIAAFSFEEGAKWATARALNLISDYIEGGIIPGNPEDEKAKYILQELKRELKEDAE